MYAPGRMATAQMISRWSLMALGETSEAITVLEEGVRLSETVTHEFSARGVAHARAESGDLRGGRLLLRQTHRGCSPSGRILHHPVDCVTGVHQGDLCPRRVVGRRPAERDPWEAICWLRPCAGLLPIGRFRRPYPKVSSSTRSS